MLLIDGYNLMKKCERGGCAFRGEFRRQREQFLTQLAVRLEAYAGEIVLVFDNRKQDFDFARVCRFQHLKLIFTPKGEEADHRIVRIVQGAPLPKEITVVSSDQEVQRNVKVHGAEVMPSEDFIERWMSSSERDKVRKQRRDVQLTPLEVEKVMQQQGLDEIERLCRKVNKEVLGDREA